MQLEEVVLRIGPRTRASCPWTLGEVFPSNLCCKSRGVPSHVWFPWLYVFLPRSKASPSSESFPNRRLSYWPRVIKAVNYGSNG